MKVFIENEAGKYIKNIYNEKTLEYIKTVTVSAAYPFAYGFVLNTTSGDGDNIDCFVFSDEHLQNEQIVEVVPIALMEMHEDGEIDHKVIAHLKGQRQVLDEPSKEKLITFCSKVFSHLPDKKMKVGRFLSKSFAQQFVRAHQD